MSGAAVTVRINGIAELQAKLTPALAVDPMRSFFTSAGYAVVRHAKANTKPHEFTGDVFDSFVTELVPGSGIPGGVVVANTSGHSLYLEQGTAPHFPPIAAVAPWAEAHGIAPYTVALGIAKHGTKAHPFLGPAMEQSRAEIDGLLGAAARDIERIAGR